MASIVDMVVPPTGEVIDSARLVNWIVSPGQAFKVGEVLLEIETDKSIIEVPSHEAGVMIEHLVGIDGVLNADTLIARIQVEREPDSNTQESILPVAQEKQRVPESSNFPLVGKAEPSRRASTDTRGSHKRKFATPAARRLAAERGVAIDTIKGTGPSERVTQGDLLRRLRPSKPSDAVDTAMAALGRSGMREAFIETTHGEISINLWESPSDRIGPTVVLIHGMFGDSSTWASMAHATHRAGLRVLAMDLPCHGKSKSETTDFAKIVETVAEVISKHCMGPVALIGHSFGGAVAARVARKSNLCVESLMLIAPVGMGTEIEHSFLSGMTYADSNEAMQRELAKLTAAGIVPSTAYIAELRARIEVRRDLLLKLCRQVSWKGVQQLDVMPDLAALNGLSMVIQGRRDEIIPWQQVLNLPPRVALHLIPDAGHMPQWESTALVTDIVLDTLLR